MKKPKLKYTKEEAGEIMPIIVTIINRYWKSVKFPEQVTKHELQTVRVMRGEYSFVFYKNKLLGGTDYTRINFLASDIQEIRINSTQTPPTQIIIQLKNNVSIWLSRGNYESATVEINTEERRKDKP